MPQKLGQHFLTDTNALQRIAADLSITASDIVIEIGPGHGELTDHIIKNGPAKLLLIEKDPKLAAALRTRYAAAQQPSVSIYNDDVRDALATIVEKEVPAGATYKVIGNIPYYLTGFLLRILSELPRMPVSIVLTMQKEVAERLAAHPPLMNKLAASIQFWADAEITMTIPASSFKPAPEVDSATIRLTPKKMELDPQHYFSFVHRLFQQPRKTIGNNLISKEMSPAERTRIGETLESLTIFPTERAQTLDISQIIELARRLGAY